jgi:rubrerythrin
MDVEMRHLRALLAIAEELNPPRSDFTSPSRR